MEDMKSKFIKGASNVKEKFETSQEINDFKAEVKKLQKERTNYIIELGEDAYSNFRKGELVKLSFVDEIKTLDKKIFDLLKSIEKIRRIEAGQMCECGSPLTPDDKFCKKCGKKVEEFTEMNSEDGLECPTCKTLNLKSNNYCNSCGYKLT